MRLATRVWHPVTIAGCLAALAVLDPWLALGATAGFATSGSV